jgi:L-lactate dehydrogenase complex protein LldG
MATTTTSLSAFADALAAHGGVLTRTTPGEAGSVIADVAGDPAVGVPLPFEGVTYPDAVTVDPTPATLEAAHTGITPAAAGVADYGSVLLDSSVDGTEPVSLYPELHVAVLRAGDVVADLPTALRQFGANARDADASTVLATGPSATADMGDLVYGAHGPEAVHVVMLDE